MLKIMYFKVIFLRAFGIKASAEEFEDFELEYH